MTRTSKGEGNFIKCANANPVVIEIPLRKNKFPSHL